VVYVIVVTISLYELHRWKNVNHHKCHYDAKLAELPNIAVKNQDVVAGYFC